MSDNQIKRFALLSVGIYATLRIAERVSRVVGAIGNDRYNQGFEEGQRHTEFMSRIQPLNPTGPNPVGADMNHTPAPNSAEREQ